MNRDAHYRAQLQALQVDMQLLVKADPYRSTPLDDTGEDVAEMVAAATGAIGVHSADNGGAQAGLRRAEGDTAALAGRYYMPFVEQVNNIMEERDAQLTMLEVGFKSSSLPVVCYPHPYRNANSYNLEKVHARSPRDSEYQPLQYPTCRRRACDTFPNRTRAADAKPGREEETLNAGKRAT